MEDKIYLNKKKQERQSLEMERLRARQEKTAMKDNGLEAAEDDLSSVESE